MFFKIRLQKAPTPPELQKRLNASPELQKRLNSLVDDITNAFYVNIFRGLFEKDKLLYSFMISININLESKEINLREWNYFLKGSPNDIPLTKD